MVKEKTGERRETRRQRPFRLSLPSRAKTDCPPQATTNVTVKEEITGETGQAEQPRDVCFRDSPPRRAQQQSNSPHHLAEEVFSIIHCCITNHPKPVA